MAKRGSKTSKSANAVETPLTAEMPIVVLTGKETMLKEQKLRELRDALQAVHGPEGVDTLRFDGQTAQLHEVMDELTTYGLMVQHKLWGIDEAEKFLLEQDDEQGAKSSGRVKSPRKVMEAYADKPVDHATLLLRSESWRAGNLDKIIAKRGGAVLKLEPLPPAAAAKWLMDRAKQHYKCKLDREAANGLIDRLGPGLLRLDTELAKLAAMVNVGETISAEVVAAAVGRTSEDEAWVVQEPLLQAMLTGDAGAAINMIHDLIDLKRESDVLIGYFVCDLMRKLCVAKMMVLRKEHDNAIAKAAGVWGPRRAMFFDVLKRLSGPQTRILFERALELDRRAKSGFGNGLRNLECFCAALADMR